MVISWQALWAISPTVRMMASGQRYESFKAYDTQSAMHRNLEYRTLEVLQKGVLNFF